MSTAHFVFPAAQMADRSCNGMSKTVVQGKSVEYKTRTYHGRGGLERPAGQPEEVGQDWLPTELFAQEKTVHRSLQGFEETCKDSQEARTSEILCKPTTEQNQRLTRCLSTVYHRFISGKRSVFVPCFRPVERRLFISINPFHARHVREFNR